MTILNTAVFHGLYNTYLKLNKDDITKKQKTPYVFILSSTSQYCNFNRPMGIQPIILALLKLSHYDLPDYLGVKNFKMVNLTWLLS